MERLGVKMEFSQKQRTWLKGVIFLFTAAASVAVLSSDCNAQLFRRHRARQWAAAPNYVEPQLNAGVSSLHENRISDRAVASRLPKWPFANGYDPRTHRDADAFSKYPKYIGGFHSSHFTNVGLPSGDIGFRGNGLYWTPW